MISRLHGNVLKDAPGEVTVNVSGVGYRVQMPMTAWDQVKEGAEMTLWISTYVREDRLDLYGFLTKADRSLFQALLDLQGIGPKLGLELCAVPKSLIEEALVRNDPGVLQNVKGVGKKTAEKLLIELRALREKTPGILAAEGKGETRSFGFDPDAMAALSQLGFSTNDIVRALEKLPKDLKTTEERVSLALRNL